MKIYLDLCNVYPIKVLKTYFICRNSNVGDLFVEALRSGQLDLPETGGTKKLRLLEIISNKIFTVCGEDVSLDVLLSQVVRHFKTLSSNLSVSSKFERKVLI